MRTFRPRPRTSVPAVLLLGVLLLTSCGGGGQTADEDAADPPAPITPDEGAGGETALGPVTVALPTGWSTVEDLPEGRYGPTYGARGPEVGGVAPAVAVIDEDPSREAAAEAAEALVALGETPGGAGAGATSAQVSWPGADDAWYVMGEQTVPLEAGSSTGGPQDGPAEVVLVVESLLLDVDGAMVGVTVSAPARESAAAHDVLASTAIG